MGDHKQSDRLWAWPATSASPIGDWFCTQSFRSLTARRLRWWWCQGEITHIWFLGPTGHRLTRNDNKYRDGGGGGGVETIKWPTPHLLRSNLVQSPWDWIGDSGQPQHNTNYCHSLVEVHSLINSPWPNNHHFPRIRVAGRSLVAFPGHRSLLRFDSLWPPPPNDKNCVPLIIVIRTTTDRGDCMAWPDDRVIIVSKWTIQGKVRKGTSRHHA